MRRTNAIVVIAIFILFAIHMIWGGMELAGMIKGGNALFSCLSYILLILVGVHTIIGIKLTLDTILAIKHSDAFYIRENKMFIIRRVSGFALMLFVAVHLLVFRNVGNNGVFRLGIFDIAALLSQLLMVLSLLLHLSVNIRPLRIALGFSDKKNIRTDIALVLAILLLLSGIAFIIYFLRWQRL